MLAAVPDHQWSEPFGGLVVIDAKRRRQSIDQVDLFHAHIGGIDTVERALIVAARLAEEGVLSSMKAERYAGWDAAIGAEITAGSLKLADLASRVESGELDQRPVSGDRP